MSFINHIEHSVAGYLNDQYQLEIEPASVLINKTKPEFEGSYTIVLFAYVKVAKKSPELLGQEMGEYLVKKLDFVDKFNVVKGFLNLSFTNTFWIDQLRSVNETPNYGKKIEARGKAMVEFSSPNTNKPLHLGHIRNILLGWACSQILHEVGYDIVKTQIVNDRGIAICKSMLAWKLYGEGSTPPTAGVKSDHFVGKYYVLFNQKLKEEYNEWQTSDDGKSLMRSNLKPGQKEEDFWKNYKNDYFNEHSRLGHLSKEMLLQWEDRDENTIALWSKMNDWVYEGFASTYDALGVDFDQLYYESETYLLGKDYIRQGLDNGTVYAKEDGSIWIDLEEEGLGQKILLRSDGTSVYMTQDIGTAHIRYEEHHMDTMVYVVGDEQDYHFQALFAILKRFNAPFAERLFHLSYGMVDLPTGKMKSREGTVVDADDLIQEVIDEARESAKERGEVQNLNAEEQEEIYKILGLGALKYFILRVQAKKRMVFDPKESLDMQGQTGPYIQNAYVRILSILNKNVNDLRDIREYEPLDIEKQIIQELIAYPDILEMAARELDPSLVANYCYQLAKLFHRYYHDVRILGAESDNARNFRLTLALNVSKVLKRAMHLIGIEMPNKM